MLERFYRTNAGSLQRVYDRMPNIVRSGLTTMRGWTLARNRYSRSSQALLEELCSHQRWTKEQIEDSQIRNLQIILDLSTANCRFYRDYSQLKIRSLSDWHAIPLLTREQLRADSSALFNQAVPPDDRIIVATTGTTGASLKVCYTTEVMRKNWAFRMQQFRWAGIEPRTPRITAFGNKVVPASRRTPPYWVYNAAERQAFVSIFHLATTTAPEYIKFLRKHSGWIVEGFPSVLSILADYVISSGEPIPMRTIFTDGEPMHPFLRDKLEAAFSAPLFNTYGNTELCGLIQQCERGGMHLNTDYAYLEILDEENRPVPPGQVGYLVWTGFLNDAMPLLRYRIGDRGSWSTETCGCGRNTPLVDPGVTRECDVLYAADGRVFSPRSVNQVLKGTTAFRFCQFIQREAGQVLIRAVGEGEHAEHELRKVRQEIKVLMGEQSDIETELASTPVIRPGGKTPLIVQQSKQSELVIT